MMTDLTLAKETRLFLLSIVVGVGLSLLYDLLRVLRLQTRHRPIVVSLEDLLYFLVCAAVTFGFALKDNSGQIRGYILIGELLAIQEEATLEKTLPRLKQGRPEADAAR